MSSSAPTAAPHSPAQPRTAQPSPAQPSPAQPSRNVHGLAVGDCWRYGVENLMREEFTAEYLQRTDGNEADGSLRVNDGNTRLDP